MSACLVLWSGLRKAGNISAISAAVPRAYSCKFGELQKFRRTKLPRNASAGSGKHKFTMVSRTGPKIGMPYGYSTFECFMQKMFIV